MAAQSTLEILNELIALHYRSLPIYLSFAAPSWHRGDERAKETLAIIAADQQATVDRLGELVVESGGAVEYGEFPMVFTGYHDLSFDFLLGRLIECQRRDVRVIERYVQELRLAPMAKALAEEALGAANAHLESLLELRTPASTSVAG